MDWLMGFQSRARTPRDLGRRPRRSKSKSKPGKHGTGGAYRLEEEHTLTAAEIVDRTLNSLSRLGNQRFAVAPFHEHYDRWLLSVRNVISELEASSTVTVDDHFKDECLRVLSDIELTLKDRRAKEVSNDEAARFVNRDFLDTQSLLAQTEREYAAKMNEIAAKREDAIKPVATNLGRLRQELSRISRMRAGFLRGISKKVKAHKTTEATQKLDTTKRKLATIEQSFATEQKKLQGEHERRRRQILEQIANYQKEIANLESGPKVDDALDVRHATCDALVNAVKSLLQRTQSVPEYASKP
jgi:DNA repair exonuclease SbcCD ATPase subunit